MEITNQLILINGSDKTGSIASFRFIGNKCNVAYSNSPRVYSYNAGNVRVLKLQKELTPTDVIIKVNGNVISEASRILDFGEYFHVARSGRKGITIKKSEAEISANCLADENNKGLFSYFKATAAAVSLTSENGMLDRMFAISVMDEGCDGRKAYEALVMAVYARKVFGMFGGEEKGVQLRFTNKLAGAIIDRLSNDVMLIPDGDEHFTVRTNVVVSPQFFAWVCGFADDAQIIAPDDVVLKMKEHVEKIAGMYR